MNIKQKILAGFGILLLMVSIIGVFMLRQVNKLGDALDVILRENYRSVILCLDVNDALERLDSGMLASFSGLQHLDPEYFQTQKQRILCAWDEEMKNVTVLGEEKHAEEVRIRLAEYLSLVPKILNAPRNDAKMRELYLTRAYPLFLELKKTTGEIRSLNQNNMVEANNAARLEARRLHNQGLMLLSACIAVVLLFSYLLTRWIQRPIQNLLAMTDEISNGNLSLVIESKSKDEIGRLSRSFNTMAIALRNAQNRLESKLLRSERMNKDVFRELPTPIAIFDARSGRIVITTQSAAKKFGFEEGVCISELKFEWLKEIFTKIRRDAAICVAEKNNGVVSYSENGKEYYFEPTAVPIPSGTTPEQMTEIVIIMKDITLAHEQQELKHSVISTVSHQLKMPLTSLRIGIYLLLEEKCGELNSEQLDLLLSMREDSDRLMEIISELLDLSKVSYSGRLPAESHFPNELLCHARDRFLSECQDLSIELNVDCDLFVPAVSIARNRIGCVLDNLISNAIRFTPPGGEIRLSAKAIENEVEFTVSDTGSGMPDEVQTHLFEQFYRGPGQNSASGVGLGLAIVKEIITAYGGKISVQSKVNAGTVFHFTLPIASENVLKGSKP